MEYLLGAVSSFCRQSINVLRFDRQVILL